MISEILAFLSLILMSFVSLYSLRRLGKLEERIPELDDYVQFSVEDGKEIVTIDKRLQAMLQFAGQTLFQSAKMGLLGGLSGQARLQKGLKGAVAQDIVEEKIPLLAAAGEFLGFNTKQYIAKNPDALFQLMEIPAVQQFLGQIMQGKGQANPQGGGW